MERKDILNSKSCHRLQVLNFELNKRAIDLDDERAILADALQDYTGGMILEQALHEVCTDLAALEAQDVALHQQIVQETEKLGQLEKKLETVGQILQSRITWLTKRRLHVPPAEVEA